jgi:hypothetical protein
MTMVLKWMPWSLVRDVVMGVLKMVVEDSDNKLDNELLDIVEGVIGKAECEHPDL